MFVSVTIKLVVSMIGVLFFLKLSGKTQMSQIGPINTVNGFVLGAIIGGIIYTPSLSVWYLVYAIVMWSLVNYFVNFLTRFQLFKKILHGSYEYLIRDGVLNMKTLKRNNLSIEQLRALLREQDIFSLLDVDDVRFEADGQLTISRKREIPQAYLFINEGMIVEQNLIDSKKTKKWLLEELSKIGVKKIDDVYCAEWTSGRGFYVVDKAGKIQYYLTKEKTKNRKKQQVQQEKNEEKAKKA